MASALSPVMTTSRDVGDEHLPGRLLALPVCGHRSGGNGSSGDLRLAWPVVLFSLLRVEGWAVQGEVGIPLEAPPCGRPASSQSGGRRPRNGPMPEMRGEPSARSVAIVLWRPASNSFRTLPAKSGSACSNSCHDGTAAERNRVQKPMVLDGKSLSVVREPVWRTMLSL